MLLPACIPKKLPEAPPIGVIEKTLIAPQMRICNSGQLQRSIMPARKLSVFWRVE
jgi:hypothetical protein